MHRKTEATPKQEQFVHRILSNELEQRAEMTNLMALAEHPCHQVQSKIRTKGK